MISIKKEPLAKRAERERRWERPPCLRADTHRQAGLDDSDLPLAPTRKSLYYFLHNQTFARGSKGSGFPAKLQGINLIVKN
ncbi:MAG: hypothetical protein R6V10_07640 [bacterium]